MKKTLKIFSLFCFAMVFSFIFMSCSCTPYSTASSIHFGMETKASFEENHKYYYTFTLKTNEYLSSITVNTENTSASFNLELFLDSDQKDENGNIDRKNVIELLQNKDDIDSTIDIYTPKTQTQSGKYFIVFDCTGSGNITFVVNKQSA